MPTAAAAPLGRPFPAAATAGGGGQMRRTTSCCPSVQKFVVIQYRIRPAGKFGISAAKKSGRSNMIRCWVLSAVTDMTSVEAICDPMNNAIRTTSSAPCALCARSEMKRKPWPPASVLKSLLRSR